MSKEMLRPNKSLAMVRMGRALEEIPALSQLRAVPEEFTKWQRSARLAISYAFGMDSDHIQEFNKIIFYASISTADPIFNAEVAENVYRGGLSTAKAILESMLDEIEEYWQDDTSPPSQPGGSTIPEQTVSNRVFVVHGRVGGTRDTVARYLETLKLEAVILQERASEGRTIIEKLEDYSDVRYAVVLCTQDDVGALATERDKLRPRPRQNVVLELGFFLGELGRNRVCALIVGDMEMPSDYDGVLYIPLDDSGGWKLTLSIELDAAGLPVDMNDLLPSR